MRRIILARLLSSGNGLAMTRLLDRRITMRYMLLIYTQEDEVARRSVEEMTKVKEAHRAVMSDARSRGILEGAEPLRPTRTARTVRTHNGKLLTSDGPFAETKEQLAGYYILNCKDLDEEIGRAHV